MRSQMVDQLRRSIVGQTDVIEQILAAIFTRGHCLLVGVPGLAKTLMVSTISQILDVSFKRIQFTPDLMPSDIVGTTILDEQEVGRRDVRFVPVGDYVVDYVARLVRATRPQDPTAPDFVKKMVDWGGGPRAGIFLIQGGKAMAAMDGRFSVAIEDIKKVAIPVLRHRISA